MDENADSEQLDQTVLAGIMAGYIRYAVAQKSRFEAAGKEPPVTEDGDHNRFLWCRIRYPGFFRHVARQIDLPKYNDRIVGIATAAATAALKERPTLKDWTLAMGEQRRHETVARFQRRLTGLYAPDAIHVHGAEGLDDERMRVVSTSFDPLAGIAVADAMPVGEIDLDAWKAAPTAKFRSLEDWVNVSSALHAAYPEQLRIWSIVYKAVRDAAKSLGFPAASRTVTFPTTTNVIANHAASICADAWWIQRSPAVKESLLSTPRVFEYTESDARAAAVLWLDLAQLSPDWSRAGFFLLKHAALGLQRWGATAEAAILVAEASNMHGISSVQKAAMLSDAGYFWRGAGRNDEAAAAYRIAVPLLDSAQETYLRVIVRVNLAEVLGGPARNPEAANVLQAALHIAGDDRRCLAGFWRNVSTMFGRLGEELREEAALEGLLPYLPECPDVTQTSARQRLLDLQARLAQRRPLEPEAGLQHSAPGAFLQKPTDRPPSAGRGPRP